MNKNGKFISLIMALALVMFSGCASVVPVAATPENLTLAEAEETVEQVMLNYPFYEKVKVDNQSLTFVNTETSGKKIQVPFASIFKTMTERGFLNGEYQPALVTVYYKDNQFNVLKFFAPCSNLKEASRFVSALKKLELIAKKANKSQLSELERAYEKGILTRREYLEKKEQMIQKW